MPKNKKKTIQRSDICIELEKRTGLDRYLISKIHDEFMKYLIENLVAGNDVILRGMGIITTKTQIKKVMKNPRTGQIVRQAVFHCLYLRKSRRIWDRINRTGYAHL